MPPYTLITDLHWGQLYCLVLDGTVRLSAAKCKAMDIRQKKTITLLMRNLIPAHVESKFSHVAQGKREMEPV